jgi:hypothetical protein
MRDAKVPAKKTSEYERFMALTDAEKDAEVAVFERPLALGPDGLPGKPLRARDKALDRRAAARRAGRPRVGKGAKIVPVSIERGLLKDADAFARRHHLKRSQMVAAGLRLVMQQWTKAG